MAYPDSPQLRREQIYQSGVIFLMIEIDETQELTEIIYRWIKMISDFLFSGIQHYFTLLHSRNRHDENKTLPAGELPVSLRLLKYMPSKQHSCTAG